MILLNEDETISTPQLNGYYQQDFESLAQSFSQIFTQLNETGAAVSIFYRGQQVVDLYGSYHSENGRWKAEDRVCTMSCCKAPLALCLHLLAERGLVVLEDNVAKYWPEFAQNGKDNVKIYQVLNHTSGLPVVKNCKPGDIFNWQAMTKALEESPLVFEEGTQLTYHALTFGHLIGELIHRIDGRMPADFFHQEISIPFGIDYDLRYFPEHSIRSIKLASQGKSFSPWIYSRLLPLVPSWKLQYFRPCNGDYQPNSKIWANSEIPAVTGQGSASGLAKLYAFLAHKGKLKDQRLCKAATVAEFSQLSFEAAELATGLQWRMGLGFMLNSPEIIRLGPNSNTFGHLGMGGAIGFADCDNQLAFAYVTEHYHQPIKKDKSLAGKRLQHLISACYKCIYP